MSIPIPSNRILLLMGGGVAILIVLIFLGWLLSSASSADPTAEDVVAAFEAEGLEVGDTFPVDEEGQQSSPLPRTYEEGIRFVIPSSCPDDECGGRVFSFENEDDLNQVYNYYDALIDIPLLGGGYVYRNGLLVLQIGSDTPKAKAEEYREVFEDL